MDALPGIVDCARKTWQGGNVILVSAPSPMLKVATSIKKFMSAVNSTVSCELTEDMARMPHALDACACI